jgi:predicted permease
MLGRDLRAAAAMARRKPVFAGITTATLALAIAANTTIFALVEATILRTPPYPRPEGLVVARELGTRGQEMAASWPTFLDWQRSGVFSAAGAYTSEGTSVLGGARPQRVLGAAVSAGFFEALGVAPAVGRVPRPAEHAVPVVVVSDRFWREALRGEPLDRRALEIEGHRFEVLGVMPPSFDLPRGAQLWVPVELFEPSPARTAHNYRVVGRLAPGVTVAAAEQRLADLTRRVAGTDNGPVTDQYLPVGARVRTLQADQARPVRSGLLLLLGAAAFVLLVACLNLASGFLARGLERQRELSVRTALGASRRRLLSQLLAEAGLLAAFGAIAGVGLALGLGRLLRLVAPPLLAGASVRLDLRGGGYTLLAAVVSVLIAGLLPALLVTRAPAVSLGERGEGVQAGHRRTWGVLVAVQAALALLLLAGAGLLLRAFTGLLRADLGFEPARVATLELAPPASRYPDDAALVGLQDRLVASLMATPGVEAAGLGSEVPFDGFDPSGRMVAAPERAGDASYRLATAGYFRALGIPLRAGRSFDDRDRLGSPHSALVDEAAAELFWPGESPIGKRISSEGMDEWGGFGDRPREWATVVGVVGNVRQRALEQPPYPTVYFALSQRPRGEVTLVARSRTDASDLVPVLGETLARLAADVPGETSTLAAVLASVRAQRRFSLLLLSLFAGLGLTLAAVGVYGVVAYSVSRRTRELGVRLALGAAPAQARALVLRGALLPVAVGAATGIALAPPLGASLAAMLHPVRPWDPASWLAALGLLALAAVAAAWLPARRAARLDPVRSLRAD